MQKTIISDTSCLILLQKINEFDLLHQIFGTIIITHEVAEEFGLPLPPWFVLQQPQSTISQAKFELSVDKGEASSIALAFELKDSLLIIDDLKGRKLAQDLGILIIGTIGIIVEAKLSGIIPSVKPILKKIKSTNFRISVQLELLVLERAGEYK